ncbi:MAG: RDD family protein [Burkholderiales bacterium]|nr:RDD family protein [Burkholderiales bacterium]
MKSISIYNALGIVEAASDKEVTFALRRLLRYAYKKTRDNIGTSEESLRFFNHASQILSHPKRRDLYDKEWRQSRHAGGERMHLVSAVAGNRSRFALPRVKLTPPNAAMPADPAAENAPTEVIAPPEKAEGLPSAARFPKLSLLATNVRPWVQRIPTLLPTLREVFQGNDSPPEENGDHKLPLPPTLKNPVTTLETLSGKTKEEEKETFSQCYHPLLTEAVVVAQSPLSALIGAGLALFLAAVLLFSNASIVVSSFEFSKIWLWLPVLLLSLVIYTAGFHRPADHIRSNFHIVSPPNEEAVRGWRRRNMVFMGSNLFAEESSWIFQLRLAELERGRLQRTTVAPIWRRAVARLFDYLIWGWFLFFVLRELNSIGILPSAANEFINHPLVAPVIISLLWVPVEALMTAAVGTTLGKWLFGIYVQFSVSNPYASRMSGDCWKQALTRAFRVWRQGVGFGLWPFAVFTAARALATVRIYEETEWDSDLDSMVSYTPLQIYSQVVAFGGTALMLVLFLILWQGQVVSTFEPNRQEIALLDASASTFSSQAEANFKAFHEEAVRVSEESKLLMERQQWRRAYESCVVWARLSVANPEPFRCQGTALQHMGRHQEAIRAFRIAQFYSPRDRSLDEDIKKSQDEIFYLLNK